MIEITQVTRRFGDHLALQDVSFTAPNGTVTGFVGPNGAGKSTLLRIVTGLDKPTNGSISIDGELVRHGEARINLGALLDAAWVHPRRTAKDHLIALALIQEVPLTRVGEVLELTGLSSVAKRRTGQFSLGMKQRLGIAAALLTKPTNIIFDEPVNGLDPDGVIWVRHLAKDLAANGAAVLMSSHLLAEMAQTADRVVVIGKGRVISEGSIEQFTQGTTAASLVAATDTGAFAAICRRFGAEVSSEGDGLLRVTLEPKAVGQLALTNGIVLTHLARETVSLEARFRELTNDSVEYRGDLVACGKEAR